MSGVKVLSPVVERYALVVSIPMQRTMLIMKDNIAEAEEYFCLKRDKATEHEEKVEFDRARALLKYAASCGGELEELRYKDSKLKVMLSFDSEDQMYGFKNSMATAVAVASLH